MDGLDNAANLTGSDTYLGSDMAAQVPSCIVTLKLEWLSGLRCLADIRDGQKISTMHRFPLRQLTDVHTKSQ